VHVRRQLLRPLAADPGIDADRFAAGGYYRRINGEHPDWDAHRRAKQQQQRVLLRISIDKAGPTRARRYGLVTGYAAPPRPTDNHTGLDLSSLHLGGRSLLAEPASEWNAWTDQCAEPLDDVGHDRFEWQGERP
jgi:hypothetical protein